MRVVLPDKFFSRSTLKVAEDLLGKVLVRKLGSHVYRYRIIETEAYCGQDDLACHAHKGKTPRTEIMFGPAGFIYVYLIYGMYHCLNLVTFLPGEGEAVLIRAIEPLFKTDKRTNGPGKLCRALKIDIELNRRKLSKQTGLWVEDDGFVVKSTDIGTSSRRGVTYAKHCADYPWRFFLKKLTFIS